MMNIFALMIVASSLNFSIYLQSLIQFLEKDDAYRRCQKFYTHTNIRILNPQKQFDLQAQIDNKGKSETLDVLEGLHRYAREHVLLVGQPVNQKVFSRRAIAKVFVVYNTV